MSKRILLITSEIVPFHYGGIGTLFKVLAKTLRRRGYEVALLGERPADFDEEVFRRYYGDITYFLHERVSCCDGTSLLDGAREVWRTFREIQPLFRPDVVVGADFGGECLLLFLDAQSGQYPETTFVLTINGMTSDINAVFEGGEQGFWERWLWDPQLRLAEAMEKLTVSLADRIVAPTLWVWNQVRDRTGIEREARIIPNLSDADLFETTSEMDPVALSDPLILFVGRLDRTKGADILLDAYLHLAEQRLAFLPRLVFVGRDCLWKAYGSTFIDHWKPFIPPALQDRIVFAGQINHEEVRNYLRRAMLCVFPSRWEAYGIVCLEAMQTGCPVLVSRNTGLADVVGPAFPELLFDVDAGPKGLAEAIRKLMATRPSKPDLPAQLRQRARHILHEAEREWVTFLEGCGEKYRTQGTYPVPGDFFADIRQVLMPVDELQQIAPIAHTRLTVYFRQDGTYSEDHSLSLAYPAFRWITLRLGLPAGIVESPLRVDPADETGLILVDSISLIRDDVEIWHCEGPDAFRCLAVHGNVDRSMLGRSLALAAKNSDPQILIDCPVTDAPTVLKIRLCFGPHR
ncbi:MAG: glycosyltransferase family 4 protein [Deltaproteobacteria bacterium]|nr:glycosyltransferase family 4 protein [Deltaproteobacteria bacterium]